MKFATQWLRDFVQFSQSSQDLAVVLTNLGLEVETITDEGEFEVAVPPNRADCLGMQGIAREVACYLAKPLKRITKPQLELSHKETFTLDIQDKAACPRYLGRVIKNIDQAVCVPDWLSQRLEQAGIQLISPVVDITNYVMLELGQPLHAFDLAKLDSTIQVRKAKSGEQLVLLDGQEIILQPDTLVIADAKGPVAVAGIMGGLASGVANTSKDIFLECAYFEPIGIRLTARTHKLQSDSSYRFERGIDPNLCVLAIERASELIVSIVGGQLGPIVSKEEPKYLPSEKTIVLRHDRIEKILGCQISAQKIEEILMRLEISFRKDKENIDWQTTVPSFRQDLELEEDLIEEIARMIGYDNIEAKMPEISLNMVGHPEEKPILSELKSCLIDCGYTEIVTYSFVEPSLQEKLFPGIQSYGLQNPISEDLSQMRVSLWPGLIQTAQHNYRRQCHNISLFETGLVFQGSRGDNLIQQPSLAGICLGNAMPEQWGVATRRVDFFDIKGHLEALFEQNHLQSEIHYSAPSKDSDYPALHPGQTAVIQYQDQQIGVLGALHPKLQAELDLGGEGESIFLFELTLSKLKNNLPKFSPISKFPSVRRDLAIVLNQAILANELAQTIALHFGRLLQSLLFFDVYQGQGIPQGKKSLGFGVVLQHAERTLTEEEVNETITELLAKLRHQFGATLRNE